MIPSAIALFDGEATIALATIAIPDKQTESSSTGGRAYRRQFRASAFFWGAQAAGRLSVTNSWGAFVACSRQAAANYRPAACAPQQQKFRSRVVAGNSKT